jgi:hypothetical protein
MALFLFKQLTTRASKRYTSQSEEKNRSELFTFTTNIAHESRKNGIMLGQIEKNSMTEDLKMRLSLLPGDTLELFHVGGADRCSEEHETFDLSLLFPALVVLDEDGHVPDVLKLDVLECHRFAFLHVFSRQPGCSTGKRLTDQSFITKQYCKYNMTFEFERLKGERLTGVYFSHLQNNHIK